MKPKIVAGAPVQRFIEKSMFVRYFLISSLVSLAIHMYGPYWSAYLYLNGIDVATVVLLTSISRICVTVLNIPTGLFADRYGRRTSHSIGMLINALGLLLLILFPKHLLLLTLAFIIMACGDSFRIGALEAWVVDECKKRGYRNLVPQVFGKRTTLDYVIGVVCGFLGGLLTVYSLHLPLFLSSIAALTSAILGLAFLSENYGFKSSLVVITRKAFTLLFNSKSVKLYILGHTLITAVWAFYISTWTKLVLTLGLHKSLIGPLYSLLLLSASFGGAVFTVFTKKWSYSVIGFSALLLSSPSLLLIGFSNVLYTVLVGLILFELSLGALTPYLTSLRNDLLESSYRATAISLIHTIDTILRVSLMYVLSLISTTKSISESYLTCSVLVALSALPLYYSRKAKT